MQEDLSQIQQRMLDIMADLVKCTEKWVNDLLKDALQPEVLLRFIRETGLDISAIPSLMSRQTQIDPYRILGLDKTDADEAVKKRFRELVHRLHPDTAGFEGTSFLLQTVLAAYEMIKKERGWK